MEERRFNFEKRKEIDTLKESEEKYRNIIEHANEVILILQNEMITYINKKGVELIGIPRDKIIGMPFIFFIHPDDKYLLVDRYNKRLKNESVPESYIFRGITITQEVHILLASVNDIIWEGKLGKIYVLIDITNYKELIKSIS